MKELQFADLIEEDRTRAGGGGGCLELSLRQDLTHATARLFQEGMAHFLGRGLRRLRMDVAVISIIDSTGIGALMEFVRRFRDEGGTFVVLDPSPGIRNIFRILRLDQVIAIEETAREETDGDPGRTVPGSSQSPVPTGVPGMRRREALAESIIERLSLAELVEDLTPDDRATEALLRLKSDVTVANSRLFRKCFEMYRRFGVLRLELDFSQVGFIDSAGIGILVEAVRELKKLGGEVSLVNPNGGIRNILRVVRIDRIVRILEVPTIPVRDGQPG